jgi:aconitase A
MKNRSIICLLAVLLFNINLVGGNNRENTNIESKIKQRVAFRITPEEISKNAVNIQTADLERKDISRIAFRNNIGQVSESATQADVSELVNRTILSFKLNVEDVVKAMSMAQAMHELAGSVIGFSLDLNSVADHRIQTDGTGIETDAVAFTLNLGQVTAYAINFNENELVTEAILLTKSKELPGNQD